MQNQHSLPDEIRSNEHNQESEKNEIEDRRKSHHPNQEVKFGKQQNKLEFNIQDDGKRREEDKNEVYAAKYNKTKQDDNIQDGMYDTPEHRKQHMHKMVNSSFEKGKNNHGHSKRQGRLGNEYTFAKKRTTDEPDFSSNERSNEPIRKSNIKDKSRSPSHNPK